MGKLVVISGDIYSGKCEMIKIILNSESVKKYRDKVVVIDMKADHGISQICKENDLQYALCDTPSAFNQISTSVANGRVEIAVIDEFDATCAFLGISLQETFKILQELSIKYPVTIIISSISLAKRLVYSTETRKSHIYSALKNEAEDGNVLESNRKLILSNISEGNYWTTEENTSNYLAIKENLKFLKETLRLGNQSLSGCLTDRQLSCIRTINNNLQNKNVQGAYHELYDFIESYKQLNNQPINVVEKAIIYNVIDQIERLISENEMLQNQNKDITK